MHAYTTKESRHWHLNRRGIRFKSDCISSPLIVRDFCRLRLLMWGGSQPLTYREIWGSGSLRTGRGGTETFGHLNNESLPWLEMEVELFPDLLKFLINAYLILTWWKVVRMDELFDHRGSLCQTSHDKTTQPRLDE